MPLWLALGAHLLMPGEGLTPRKITGLTLALAGVVLALFDTPGGTASLWGDLLALLGAMGWATLALIARATRFREIRPEAQIFWQLALSGPMLLGAAVFFGPAIRDFGPIHAAGLLFQIVVVAAFSFLFWLWLLSKYPATGVGSFAFLGPVFGVALGWLLLSEPVGWTLIAALTLVALGILLINRPQRVASRAVSRE